MLSRIFFGMEKLAWYDPEKGHSLIRYYLYCIDQAIRQLLLDTFPHFLLPKIQNFSAQVDNQVEKQKATYERLINENTAKGNLEKILWGNPELSRHTLGNYRKLINSYVLPNIEKAATVLDLGSLHGNYFKYFKNAEKIIGVDIVEPPLTIQNQLGPGQTFQFYLTHGNELKGISDGSIDFIFSVDTFSRVPKEAILSYVKEFPRVLKKGGRLCVFLPLTSKYQSVTRGFTNLSKFELMETLTASGMNTAFLDEKCLRHGVLLIWQKN
jgi:SAM-dependent methyltransferase